MLILDEPFNALDFDSVQNIGNLLLQFKQEEKRLFLQVTIRKILTFYVTRCFVYVTEIRTWKSYQAKKHFKNHRVSAHSSYYTYNRRIRFVSPLAIVLFPIHCIA